MVDVPFIHFKSLPTDKPAGVAEVLEGVCGDVSRDTGVSAEHLTATWEEVASGHYAAAGSVADHASGGSHPVLVDIVLPDSTPPEEVEAMLQSVAASLAARARVPKDRVFINARYVASGMVFDQGEIVRW